MIWIGKTEFTLTHRGQSRAFVDSVVALLAVIRLALVAADASHAVHAALVGAARAVTYKKFIYILERASVDAKQRVMDCVLSPTEVPPELRSTLQRFLWDSRGTSAQGFYQINLLFNQPLVNVKEGEEIRPSYSLKI